MLRHFFNTVVGLFLLGGGMFAWYTMFTTKAPPLPRPMLWWEWLVATGMLVIAPSTGVIILYAINRH